MASIFVLDLNYIAGPSAADRHMDAHRAYLRRHYDNGIFLASGRKEPRTGGVILATGERAEIERIVGEDPFATEGVAEYTVTEFFPTITADALAHLRHEL